MEKELEAAAVLQLDLTSREFKENPFPTLARMREAGPLVRTRLPIVGKVWLATTFEAVNEVLRDHRRFVRDGRNAGKRRLADVQWWMSQLFRAPAENMLAKDEPDHRRLRALVEQAFLRRSVEGMRGRLHELADVVLDQTIASAGGAGEIDFLEFSRQFPLAVICELLGLPAEDRARFTEWASGISRVNSLAGLLTLLPGFFKINGYFRKQFRRCRQQPRDGLFSLLVQAEEAGDSLSEAELMSMAFLLLFAGYETTTHLISCSLLALLDHPEQKAELMSDWLVAEKSADELHRYTTPVQITKPRYAARDMELLGQPVKRRQFVIAMLASANSDPAQFDEPEKIILGRSPNAHVGFGVGIHTCLGLKLARMETAIALERVLTRFPDVALATPRDQIEWTSRIGMRALKRFPVKLGG